MRAAVLQAPGRVVVTEVPAPVPGPRDVVVQVEVAGICGSDVVAFATGSYVQPGQVLGHEFAGTVIGDGEAIRDIRNGMRVTALPLGRCGTCSACADGRPNLCRRNVADAIGYGVPGGFVEQVLVRDASLGSNVFALSTAANSLGAMIEPLAVALRAVRRIDPRPGEIVAVLGLGTIGQCAARVLRHLGAEVAGVDLSTHRCDKARDGVPDGLFATDLRTALGTDSTGRTRRAHAVLDASGALPLIEEGMRALRPGGRLGVVSLPARPLEIDLKRLALLELDMRGSYAYDTEFAEAHEWLEAGRLQLDDLVTAQFPLECTDAAFRAAGRTESQVKVQLLPQA